jgi:hypothetical protein
MHEHPRHIVRAIPDLRVAAGHSWRRFIANEDILLNVLIDQSMFDVPNTGFGACASKDKRLF